MPFRLYFKNKVYEFDTLSKTEAKLAKKKESNTWESVYVLTEVKYNMLTGKRKEFVLQDGIVRCTIPGLNF